MAEGANKSAALVVEQVRWLADHVRSVDDAFLNRALALLGLLGGESAVLLPILISDNKLTCPVRTLIVAGLAVGIISVGFLLTVIAPKSTKFPTPEGLLNFVEVEDDGETIKAVVAQLLRPNKSKDEKGYVRELIDRSQHRAKYYKLALPYLILGQVLIAVGAIVAAVT